jgi:SAM-dependent methyltransferase
LTLYLDILLPTLRADASVLHFAPERALHRVFAGRKNLRYVGVDIGPRAISARADITAIPFRDGAFDLVLASHVLEHVPSDAPALGEIGRVLNPGGLAVLMVPMLPDWRERTTVEFGYANPLEEGHWRIYGQDFADRITAAGLACERAGMKSLIPADRAWRAGIVDAPVFLTRRRQEAG